MKKKFIYSVFALLLSGSVMYGQNKSSEATSIAKGDFDIVNAAGEPVHARYFVSRGLPDNLTILITPNKAFQMHARITDAKGNELIKIKQEEVTMRYANSVDISSLPAGNYFLELSYGKDDAQTYSIAFAK